MDNTKCDYCGKVMDVNDACYNICDPCMTALQEIWRLNLAGVYRDECKEKGDIDPAVWLAERREQA